MSWVLAKPSKRVDHWGLAGGRAGGRLVTSAKLLGGGFEWLASRRLPVMMVSGKKRRSVFVQAHAHTCTSRADAPPSVD